MKDMNNGHLRIGLVTDTHIPAVAKALPVELVRAFQGVDLILHAGDIYSLNVLDELEGIAPVLAALGDDDSDSALDDRRVKRRHSIELGGKRIWLLHDRGPHYYRSNLFGSRQQQQPEAEKPDVVVFGHEHEATVRQRNEMLWVNSGSPTFLNYCYGLRTVGILEIGGGEARAEIKQL